MAALFEVDGDRLVPTAWSRGPWDPGFLHGGPVAMLAGRAIEASPSPVEMRVVRLTVEFLRPVPLAPLMVQVRQIRPGKRIQLLEAMVSGPDGDAARVTGLRIRKAATEVPPEIDVPPTPGPEQLAPWTRSWSELDMDAFHSHGVEIRPVDGSTRSPGFVWIRAQVPIVEGEVLTPLARALAAADFPNGVSLRLDPTRYLSINPELTVHLHREPEGEWVHLAARTFTSPDGTGVAEGVLSDLRGQFGRSTQSLILEPRPNAAR
jgi:acyl-Coa thioesterase superfamily protein/acyl-CoA thioesterase superfamily protein